MATLTVAIQSALGTNTTTLTFSAPDAARIFTAWKNKAGPKDGAGNPIGTQSDFVAWLSAHAQDALSHLVTINELQAVSPPPMAAANS